MITFYSSTAAYWTSLDRGSGGGRGGREAAAGRAHLLESFIFAGKNTGVDAVSSSGGPCFVKTLHCDPFILCGPAWHGP